jgi:L-lactate dehydrogenase (cytochrome)
MTDAETATPTANRASFQRSAAKAPARLQSILALHDFQRVAKAHLPRMLYGYVSGAVETGAAFARAEAAYADIALVPRILVDVAGRSQTRQLFGRTYAAPFGIAPMGGAAIAAYDGDNVIARGAAACNIPGCLSAASLTRLEDVRKNGPTSWFQGYWPGDAARIDAMIDRVAAAGYDTLVLTVDVPVAGNRENNVRNGYSTPLVVTPKLAFDCVTHPAWLVGTLARTFATTGMPYFENLDAFRGPPLFSKNLARNSADRDRLSWANVAQIRRKWAGKFIIKGILSADDAALARDHGADAVVVSSHGGRQLDHAIAPLAVLPEIKAIAGNMAVLIDGGIRRGTDVLKALALGADFVLVGRPFMFAAAIGGQAAVEHGVKLLMDEIDRDMAMLGITTLDAMTPELLKIRGTQWRQ